MLTPIQHAQASAQAEAWLDKQIIEKITTPPFVNNLVMVAKPDGSTRVCVDCTPANKVTEDFDWPLPRLQDIRYRTRGMSWFARLDLKDAFFRISVPTRYRSLTAFMVGNQAYRFKRMPFGLKTAPSTFQRFMDWGLAEFREIAEWYIDDVLIMGQTKSELALNEKKIRKRLSEMKCTINEGKSVTEQRSLLFAGLWVYGQGVGPNLKKLAELLELPIPTNKESAQSALGLVSYLRDFIPLTSHFTAELYPDKGGLKLPPHEFAEQWGRLTRHLRAAATTTRHWKDGVDCDLFTDASQYGLGVLILQEKRVVALASRKLTPAETRYSATDREHLGLVYAAQKFKLFLHQSNATTRVWSDHSALVTRRVEELTPRQARWHMLVQAWIPKIAHVRGKINPADFVSRWKADELGANL